MFTVSPSINRVVTTSAASPDLHPLELKLPFMAVLFDDCGKMVHVFPSSSVYACGIFNHWEGA